MSQRPLRIAMWSGPRNISTALLRAWGNRPDTFVCDEPFYAHYLVRTGVAHPGADEVIRHQENDWRKVADWLTGPVPEGKAVFYQKHMAHHLLPDMGRDWLERVSNCFLIREPREMLTSLVHFLPEPALADTGLPQQVEIFRQVRARGGRTPPVVDARDVLEDPRGTLGLLCEALGVAFTEAMLSWPPGRRPTDGVWAKYWYAAVEKSTSFAPCAARPDPVPERLRGLHAQCEELYHQLHAHRLREV
jgi:Sulfotransferase domain